MIVNANPQAKRQSQYHMLQGVVFILFGLLFSLGAKSLADFLSYATYFILFIVIFDIIVGFTLVNSDFKWTRGNLILKYLGSLCGMIGGVVILTTFFNDQYFGLKILAIVTISIGLGMIALATRIRNALT